MPADPARHSRELLVRSLIYLPVLLLLVFQYLEASWSSERGVGITVEPEGKTVLISATRPDGPADRGGLRAGDVVVTIAGREVASFIDYDLAAEHFERGRPVDYEVRRGGQTLTLEIVPGTTVDWVPLLINSLLVLAYLTMGLLSLSRRPGSLPANLLYWLFAVLAVDIALPSTSIGAPAVGIATIAISFFLGGPQFAFELHLASLIPQKQAWLRRRPWIVSLYYAVGLTLGTVSTGTYLIAEVWQRDWLPWSFELIAGPLLSGWFLVWATLMLLFLGYPTLRYPTPQGRRQAGLVLLGAAPWSIYTYAVLLLEAMDREGPDWLYSTSAVSLTLLPLPLSIFVVLQIQSTIQNTLLMRLTGRLQGAGSVEKISELISRDLNLAFHTKCNYVFFREEAGSDLTSVHSSGARVGVENIPESYEILKIVDSRGEVLVFPDDLEGALPESEEKWLKRLRAKVVVPVMGTDQRLIGLLILGEKASEEPYIDHDFAIVRSLAAQIALAYENIGLQVQVHEQDRIQREVLDRFEDQEIYLVKECPVCGRCYDSTVELCSEDGNPLVLTLPVERTIDDRYRLDQVLGKGGVAVVYRAIDLRLSRTVAIKVLARSVMNAPDALRRFEREARIVAKLQHPRVVTIHDFGKTRQGCAYLVMEYLEGSTLGHILRNRGPYDAETTAELFDQILDGLGAAHRLGVVHRDLKPDNVLIARTEDGKKEDRGVKLLDFGLAKFHARSGVDNTDLTMPGFIIGTLAYMAPEQLSGDDADERSDLFAVGVMAYQALSGRKPYTGRTPAQVLTSMIKSDIELPGNSRAAKKLNAVLARCFAQDPARRYQSVSEVQAALIPAIRAYPALEPD